MKKYLISLLACIFSLSAFSNTVSLKGKVIDKKDNTALGYVNISLEKENKLVKGTTSVDDGTFSLNNIEAGQYTLKFTFLGYDAYSKRISISGKNKEVNIGNISLQENSKMLDDVEIVTQGSQVKFEIDKKIYSVDQSIASAGGNASEVLENIPSIEVDQDGNISLRNNSSVEIWINGKASGLTDDNRAQVLEQMPAGSIESVEVITNPSAKFSPEGSAGIINLVMKKERKAGYYGSANLAADYNTGEDNVGQRGGANINFNVGKFEGYYSLGFRNSFRGHKKTTDRYYLDSNRDTISSLFQEGTDFSNLVGQMSRYGLTYHATEKQSVGISGFILSGNRTNDTNTDYIKDSSNVILADYNRLNTNDAERLILNTSLDHEIKFNKLKELKSSLGFFSFDNISNANYLQSVRLGEASPLNQNQEIGMHNKGLEFKSDYTRKGKEVGKLEAGVNIKLNERLSSSSTENYDGANYVEIASLNNKFSYSEQLYALYTTYGMQFDKLSFQAGLRGEYLIIDNSTNGIKEKTKEYLQPFPTLFISYALPKKNELQLNYTRRVKRPRGRELNAFKNISDSTNISYGNPDLEPQFSSSIELNHIKSWDKHTLSTSIYYKFTDNIIQQIRFLNDGLLNTTYMNVSQSQSSGLELVAKNELAKYLSLTSTLNLYYYKLMASEFETEGNQLIELNGNEDFSWNFKVLANFMLTKTLSGQITSNYVSPKVLSQGETYHQYSLDFGFRKSMLDKKLNLALSIRDVLQTRNHSSFTYTDDLIQYYYSKHYSPSFRLSLSYNFGNNKKKKKNGTKEDNNGQEDMMEEF